MKNKKLEEPEDLEYLEYLLIGFLLGFSLGIRFAQWMLGAF